jgi:alkylation response protein AidB-like acyl-CoA dehydrogenase
MVAPVIMAFGSARAEGPAPAADPDVRHLVVPGLFGAWFGVGPGLPADEGRQKRRRTDDYVLNGSKIWTTHAQWADWMFCLVRTSSEGKPQEGISFLLLRMDTPGIQIKPLVTLDGPAAGEQEINQVFFDNVRVPVANRIGEENKGWTYAKYLLEFERGNAYAPGLMNMLKKVKRIAALEVADDGGRLIDDRDFREKIANLEIQVEALNATELRIFSGRRQGHRPGLVDAEMRGLGIPAGDHRADPGGGRNLCRAVRARHLDAHQ